MISHSVRMVSALVFASALCLAAGCEKAKEPSIENLDPAVGPPEGGHVTIRGAGFQAQGPVGVTVYFGDEKARVQDVKASEIAVRAPSGKAGSKVNVRLVFDNGREYVVKNAYEYKAGVHDGLSTDGLTQK